MSKGKVKVGGTTYPYHVWTKGGDDYLRAPYYLDGRRHFITHRYREPADEKKFIAKVRAKAVELQGGDIDLIKLPDNKKRLVRAILSHNPTLSDLEEFMQWKSSRAESTITLGEVCEKFLKDKESSGASTKYLKGLDQFMTRVMDGLGEGTQFCSIGFPALLDWHTENFGALSVSSRNNARQSLVTLWNWAIEKRLYLGENYAERITQIKGKAKKKDKQAVQIFTLKEGRTLLDNVSEEFTPWLLLTGWNGLRSEEVASESEDSKPRLGWEHIIWTTAEKAGHVIVPAAVSKVGIKRVIPLQPIVEKYLRPFAKASGAICHRSAANDAHETARLGKMLPNGWKRNGLRNSFITYRVAVTDSMGKTAIESGNSESMIKSNYLDATTKAQGESWFQL